MAQPGLQLSQLKKKIGRGAHYVEIDRSQSVQRGYSKSMILMKVKQFSKKLDLLQEVVIKKEKGKIEDEPNELSEAC